jgi:predicted kinase
MRPTVFIFRGAPSSGKGTLVPMFAKRLPMPVALIEQDKLRWGFHLIGRDVKDITEEEHRFAFKNTLLIYEAYLESGDYNIVLEGLFTWDDTSASQGNCMQLIELAEQYNFSYKVILLKAEKKELLQRNAKREYSVPLEEFNMLYDKIYFKIGPEEIQIDSTGRSIEQVLSDISNKATI